jgi:hypothetical protein
VRDEEAASLPVEGSFTRTLSIKWVASAQVLHGSFENIFFLD